MSLQVNKFNSRNVTERLDIVKAKGEHVCRIKYYGFLIDLYLLDQTYIEVYYNMQNRLVEEVEVLSPTDERLHLFAVQVNLSDLYKK